MVSPSAWEGVSRLLDDYIEVKPDDYAVIAYTSETYKFLAWVKVALEVRGIQARSVWMIPLIDLEFLERFSRELPSPETLSGRLVVLTLEQDTLSHDQQLRQALKAFNPDRTYVFRVISACEDLFTDALKISPLQLSAKNTTLLNLLMKAKKLRITTRRGTDLRVTLDSDKHRWISNRGVWRPETFVILPAGEVATFPSTIDGVFVADFAFNVNMITERDARLVDTPITVEVANGRAVSYSCSDSKVMKFVDECFDKYCAHIVGELGFGTNSAIEGPVRLNSHINERHPGIHLGFGQSNQNPAVVGYNCDIHLDLIASGGSVWVDDCPDAIDMTTVAESDFPHPTYTHAEDARSARLEDLTVDDCCGILTTDGIRLFASPQ